MKGVNKLEIELFVVSFIYWGSTLIFLIWLDRRLSNLKKRLAELEKGE
jgi:hypothetical protein